jgi:hypothetical protein
VIEPEVLGDSIEDRRVDEILATKVLETRCVFRDFDRRRRKGWKVGEWGMLLAVRRVYSLRPLGLWHAFLAIPEAPSALSTTHVAEAGEVCTGERSPESMEIFDGMIRAE